jgi:hypothetical protein
VVKGAKGAGREAGVGLAAVKRDASFIIWVIDKLLSIE